MSLIDTWTPYFLTQVRMRGRAYFLEGRVRQLVPAPGEMVRAHVRGNQRYTVTIHEEHGAARVGCTCPHFTDGFYCKHIWATLLDVEEHGMVGREPADADADAQASRQSTGRPSLPKARKRDPDRPTPSTTESTWERQISLLRPPLMAQPSVAPPILPTQRLVSYIVQPDLSRQYHALVVELRHHRANGQQTGRSRMLKISTDTLGELVDPVDRELCAMLLGATPVREDDYDSRFGRRATNGIFQLPIGARRHLLQRMIDTGRCFVDQGELTPAPLSWDDRPPWVLWLTGAQNGADLHLSLVLRRNGEQMAIRDPLLLLGGGDGLMIQGLVASAFDDSSASRWVSQFRDELLDGGEAGVMVVPAQDIERFLDRLYMLPQLPQIDLPAGVGRPQERVTPVAHIELSRSAGGPDKTDAGRGALETRVWFAYGDQRVRPGQAGRYVVTSEARDRHETGAAAEANGPLLIIRDHAFEQQAITQLMTLGFRANLSGQETLTLPTARMAAAVSKLIADGWIVLADQQTVRNPSAPSLSVTSGIDWFELRGQVSYETAFGSQILSLPQILAAARSGHHMIQLDDGTLGTLPQDWLDQQGLLAAIGQEFEDHLRFRSSQVALLDSLLAGQQAIAFDQKFEQARQRIAQFDQIDPLHEAPDFCGALRVYQRDGLGWLKFLRWFGMGGILADDMGLGKTVQVLAMLQARKQGHEAGRDSAEPPRNDEHRPTLVVVPKSVVFNWLDEAARFTPQLRMLAYAGADRHAMRESFADHDVIVTSYGLLRRDILELQPIAFDYVILDEAQAIKNPSSQGAKAARLLQARHRLALTGTPVENHLGDLWSIFEFLNPGMLGSASRFAQVIRGGGVRGARMNMDVAKQSGRALRPFILRRTKQQVLDELPAKTEQTLLCEMDAPQRRIYDDLRDYYRATLLHSAEGARPQGGASAFAGSAVAVLEALLRLRQAACHPALIDEKRRDVASAKLDVLVDQLTELIDEGHKALVFSQFTSMLALVRERLDTENIVYEYLDGKTRDRKQCVERFQSDEKCPVFLISLKAGGLGLNLTAADYVFILDPWWNPAVETQAIDRAHRIGQTQHVFAYRLICQDTVEQRIAELQEQKRELAEAIVGGQENLLRSLTRDELQQLLS